jgi:mRNA degradation ribonuclease J1/J2
LAKDQWVSSFKNIIMKENLNIYKISLKVNEKETVLINSLCTPASENEVKNNLQKVIREEEGEVIVKPFFSTKPIKKFEWF